MVSIKSKNNRIIGLIPFLGHTWILRSQYLNSSPPSKRKTTKMHLDRRIGIIRGTPFHGAQRVKPSHAKKARKHATNKKRKRTIPHRIHVWYIYLHLVDVYGFHVGKYTIHGSYGYHKTMFNSHTRPLPKVTFTTVRAGSSWDTWQGTAGGPVFFRQER